MQLAETASEKEHLESVLMPLDLDFEEAAALAAFYSRGKDSEKVEVDYLRRKDVKKTPGTPPGYVIYYTNYSMTITPGTDGLKME